jgi:hypothetical protein
MREHEELVTVVSVCKGSDYDWQSSIDFCFDDTEEAIKFVRLVLSQGLTCLVYDKFEKRGDIIG